MHKTLIGLALASAVALSGCGSATASSSKAVPARTGSASPSSTPLPRFSQVVLDCEGVPTMALADGGQTLHLDVKGNDDVEGITIEDAACALVHLQMPDRVSSEIDRTTAMMGVQHDAWSGIEASWTYHPDSGLDLILSDTQPVGTAS